MPVPSERSQSNGFSMRCVFACARSIGAFDGFSAGSADRVVLCSQHQQQQHISSWPRKTARQRTVNYVSITGPSTRTCSAFQNAKYYLCIRRQRCIAVAHTGRLSFANRSHETRGRNPQHVKSFARDRHEPWRLSQEVFFSCVSISVSVNRIDDKIRETVDW